jgi:hypothetical protein
MRRSSAAAPVAALAILAGGAAAAQACDSNDTGACVPIAPDGDCAGGSGNGAAQVRGPVRVIGRDVHGLDRDGDGIACD